METAVRAEKALNEKQDVIRLIAIRDVPADRARVECLLCSGRQNCGSGNTPRRLRCRG